MVKCVLEECNTFSAEYYFEGSNRIKRVKYLGLNLIKEERDLYIENYKTHSKQFKKSHINGKTSCIHGLEDFILLRCQYYSMWSTYSMKSLSKSQWVLPSQWQFFQKWKNSPKIYMEFWIPQPAIKKVGGLTLPDLLQSYSNQNIITLA